jgi:tetrahydromethanopterin S-methyltransferase subunit C
MSGKMQVGVGAGALCIAVLAMSLAVVTSSFSSTAAGTLSLLGLTAALVGFRDVAAKFLRAEGIVTPRAPRRRAPQPHVVRAEGPSPT